MVEIARPDSFFRKDQVQIRREATQNSPKAGGEQDKEALLNSLAGRKASSQFVDRNTHNKMGKDEFLKLLAHQLQNQDPLNPTDQGKFAAELAQFTQVEQLVNMNQKISELGHNAPVENKFYGASFLGKEVITSGTSIELKQEGDRSDIPFYLEGDADTVEVKILDNKGNITAKIRKQGLSKGHHTFTWDGTSLDTTAAPKGSYKIAVTAWDKNQEKVPAQTKTTGLVTGVDFQDGETVLTVNGRKIFLRDVESFRMPGPPKHSGKDHSAYLGKPLGGQIQQKPLEQTESGGQVGEQ